MGCSSLSSHSVVVFLLDLFILGSSFSQLCMQPSVCCFQIEINCNLTLPNQQSLIFNFLLDLTCCLPCIAFYFTAPPPLPPKNVPTSPPPTGSPSEENAGETYFKSFLSLDVSLLHLTLAALSPNSISNSLCQSCRASQ